MIDLLKVGSLGCGVGHDGLHRVHLSFILSETLSDGPSQLADHPMGGRDRAIGHAGHHGHGGNAHGGESIIDRVDALGNRGHIERLYRSINLFDAAIGAFEVELLLQCIERLRHAHRFRLELLSVKMESNYSLVNTGHYSFTAFSIAFNRSSNTGRRAGLM